MRKRKCDTEDSSGGQHSAGGKPLIIKASSKAKCRGGSHSAVPTSTLASSGSQYSAGKQAKSSDFTLVLVDEDNFEVGVDRNDVAYDPRPVLDQLELDDILAGKCVDVVIRVCSASFKRTTWNFTCASDCQVVNKERIPLVDRFWATSITLRRLTSCMDSMPVKLILIKTLRGKAGTEWFFGPTERQRLAFAVFDLLCSEETLTYVVGGIGFTISSFMQYWREYGVEMTDEVCPNLQFLTNENQVVELHL